MEKNGGYAGKISHAGTQEVKAPLPGNAPRGKKVVHRGTDLRTGKK